MAKSAAEERREQAAVLAVLQQQIAQQAAFQVESRAKHDALEARHAKAMDEARADRGARAKEFADFRVEAEARWKEHEALGREFGEYKRRGELRDQRLWQLGVGLILTLVGGTVTIAAAILRR